MAIDVITAKTLKPFFGKLREYLKRNATFEVLTDANMINFLNDELYNTYRDEFFGPENETIDVICASLFQAYCDEKRRVDIYMYGRRPIANTARASMIKMLLKMIKYSMVIIDESNDKQTLFYYMDTYAVLKNDDEICPENWEFLTLSQLYAKIYFSFAVSSIEPFCPVTNFRVKMNELYYNDGRMPLIVLTPESYKSSIENFVTKYIQGVSEKEGSRITDNSSANCFYIGDFCNEHVKYTPYFEELYMSFCKARNRMDHLYDGYEIIYTMESYNTKAKDIIIENKVYIFKRIEKVGYALVALFRGRIDKNLHHDAFYLNVVPQAIINDVLSRCDAFYNAKFTIAELQKLVKEKTSPTEPKELKEYRLVFRMLHRAMTEDTPQIPKFVIFV